MTRYLILVALLFVVCGCGSKSDSSTVVTNTTTTCWFGEQVFPCQQAGDVCTVTGAPVGSTQDATAASDTASGTKALTIGGNVICECGSRCDLSSEDNPNTVNTTTTATGNLGLNGQ